MNKTLNEFKQFLMRGNVLDLAVAVVIGGAFGKITKSLVDDIIMPIVGKFLGGVDFTNLFINLSDGRYDTLAEAKVAGAVTVNYGMFINTLIDFVIIGFTIFVAVKAFNKLQKKQDKKEKAEEEKKLSEEVVLLTEIRDLLKSK